MFVYKEAELRERIETKPGKEPFITNAKITDTSIGYHDGRYGIPVITISLAWEGSGQSWQFTLDSFNEELDERVGSAFTHDSIFSILEVVEVEKWEDLKGKYVRLYAPYEYDYIRGIGNIIYDKWTATPLIIEDIEARDKKIAPPVEQKEVVMISNGEVVGPYLGTLSNGWITYERQSGSSVPYSATIHPMLVEVK
jgi:hypothetical protein